jgi:hypothetical protein
MRNILKNINYLKYFNLTNIYLLSIIVIILLYIFIFMKIYKTKNNITKTSIKKPLIILNTKSIEETKLPKEGFEKLIKEAIHPMRNPKNPNEPNEHLVPKDSSNPFGSSSMDEFINNTNIRTRKPPSVIGIENYDHNTDFVHDRVRLSQDQRRLVLNDLYNDIYDDMEYFNISDLENDDTLKTPKNKFYVKTHKNKFNGGNNHTETLINSLNINNKEKKVQRKDLFNIDTNQTNKPLVPKDSKNPFGSFASSPSNDSVNPIGSFANEPLVPIGSFAPSPSMNENSEKTSISVKNINNSNKNILDNNQNKINKFNINNIIKINNKIGIIENIDNKNILIQYKIIKNLNNITSLSQLYTLENETQFKDIEIIAHSMNDFKVLLENEQIINDTREKLNKNWIEFLKNDKWFSIKIKKQFTINHTLSDVLEYIYNNIYNYTNLEEQKIENLKIIFDEEYNNVKIQINNIDIQINTIPKNYLNNIRKNIKIKLLNKLELNNFKDLKLINMMKTSNYNYEKYLNDYYNIYNIINALKNNNIKLNNKICRDLITDYRNKYDNSIIHVSDCKKEQLKIAKEQRRKLDLEIDLLKNK